jgi:hypothetical protein
MPAATRDRRTTSTAARALPTELALLAGVLRSDPADMHSALTAARAVLMRYADPENDNRRIEFDEFIQPYAEHGPHAASVRKALDADPGNMVGTLMSAYAEPGILAGIALAYLAFGPGSDTAPSGSLFQLHAILKAIGNYDNNDESDEEIAHAIGLARVSLASPHPFDGSIDTPDITKEVLRRVAGEAVTDPRESQRVIAAVLDGPLEDTPLTTTTGTVFAITAAAITHAMLVGAAVMFDTLKGGAR